MNLQGLLVQIFEGFQGFGISKVFRVCVRRVLKGCLSCVTQFRPPEYQKMANPSFHRSNYCKPMGRRSQEQVLIILGHFMLLKGVPKTRDMESFLAVLLSGPFTWKCLKI